MFEAIQEKLIARKITMSGSLPEQVDCIVTISGGKDSQCCLELACERFDNTKILAVFCDTRYEHPITYQHITDTIQRLGVHCITLNAGSVEEICIRDKRFPSRMSRHCTNNLKIRPTKHFYKELAKLQGGFEVWLGMRAGESTKRHLLYRDHVNEELHEPHTLGSQYPKLLGKLGVRFRLPIVEWSTEQVFEQLGDTVNPLYAMGEERIGCYPCLACGDHKKYIAFHRDDVGKAHYEIAKRIGYHTIQPLWTSKKFAHLNNYPNKYQQQTVESDESCDINDSGCSYCSM